MTPFSSTAENLKIWVCSSCTLSLLYFMDMVFIVLPIANGAPTFYFSPYFPASRSSSCGSHNNRASGESCRLHQSLHVHHRGRDTQKVILRRNSWLSAVYESASLRGLAHHARYIVSCICCSIYTKLLQSFWIQRRQWSRNVSGIQLFQQCVVLIGLYAATRGRKPTKELVRYRKLKFSWTKVTWYICCSWFWWYWWLQWHLNSATVITITITSTVSIRVTVTNTTTTITLLSSSTH